MEIVAIAGGSGAGKSTAAYSIVDLDPEKFEVLNLDDYQMAYRAGNESQLPSIDGITNWDHPDLIQWAKLRGDVNTLRQGNAIEISVWAHRSNLNFTSHRQRIPRMVLPRPVLIIEGNLALSPNIVDIYDRRLYLDLDLDQETRDARRITARGGVDNINGVADYTEKVLHPMHLRYVEPTKALADCVINVANLSAQDTAGAILANL